MARISALLCTILFLLPPLHAAELHTTPFIWLEKMGRALQDAHYQGHFTYRSGSSEQRLRVFHGIDNNGVMIERVMDLSGSQQEVLSLQGSLYCRLQQRFTVEQGDRDGQAYATPDSWRAHLKTSYQFISSVGEDVAGHASQLIEVVPRDKLRYGYRFWIARSAPHLLLRFEMIDTDSTPLEQMKFSSLELSEAPAGHHPSSHINLPVAEDNVKVTPGWRVVMLPSGFRPNRVQRHISEAGAQLEHHTFSDGFSSVSLFIESTESEPPFAEKRHGAVSMVSLYRDSALITVVGEVPLATVRIIASGAEPIDAQAWMESIQ